MQKKISLDFGGIPTNLNDAIADLGLLYDEFLDEVQKLRSPNFQEVETIQNTFNEYVSYSKGVEKRLKNTSAKSHMERLVDFRNKKEETLYRILWKYQQGRIPAILELELGTGIFQYPDSISELPAKQSTSVKKKIQDIINFLLNKS